MPSLMGAGVGGITVHYTTHLWSLVWRLSTCFDSCIIFSIHSNIQDLLKIPLKLNLNFQKCSKSCCNHLIKYSKFWWSQQWYSCLHMCSGGWEPELAVFLFTYSYTESLQSAGPYYTSLKRCFQGDHNAVGIVWNGSVFMEKLWKYVDKYGP